MRHHLGAACARISCRLWGLTDTTRLAQCAVDPRIEQYLHLPIAAAGPKRTVELQMLSNRRLVVLLLSTLLLICCCTGKVVHNTGRGI